MEPQTKQAVALVVHPPGDRQRLLLVQRPDVPGEELPGVWGLPAASLGPGESEEQAAHRVGWQKLGCGVRILRVLGRGAQDRLGYRLKMAVYEAEAQGPAIQLPRPRADGATYYVGWRWGPPQDLHEAAARGSLCARVALHALQPPGYSPSATSKASAE